MTKYSRDALIKALQNAFDQHGHFVLDDVSKLTGISPNTFMRRFDTWAKACEAAGYCILYGQRPAVTSKLCSHCGNPIKKPSWRNSTYCSTACSNKARSKGKWARPSRNREQWKADLAATRAKRIAESDFNDLSVEDKRRRVLYEQKNCCNRCGINSWLGEPLVLELEHKNGNNKDNSRENLEALCPNCHSLTLTWRGRNKRGPQPRIDPSLVKEKMKTGLSLSASLRECGFAGKGASHARLKEILAKSEDNNE